MASLCPLAAKNGPKPPSGAGCDAGRWRRQLPPLPRPQSTGRMHRTWGRVWAKSSVFRIDSYRRRSRHTHRGAQKEFRLQSRPSPLPPRPHGDSAIRRPHREQTQGGCACDGKCTKKEKLDVRARPYKEGRPRWVGFIQDGSYLVGKAMPPHGMPKLSPTEGAGAVEGTERAREGCFVPELKGWVCQAPSVIL